MCTSITAWRHAGFHDGGAFIILSRTGGATRREERGRSGLGEWGRASRGQNSGVWGRVGGEDEVIQDKEIFQGEPQTTHHHKF